MTNAENNKLQANPLVLSEYYKSEWNTNLSDFVMLTYNGTLVSNSLYRVGGIGGIKEGEKYHLLLKYVESYWDKDIMDASKTEDPKHLKGLWCIIDDKGNEKKVFEKSLHSPYLVKGSCVYSINSEYYNIETNEFYGRSYSSMLESKNFVFLGESYGNDFKGVKKINKLDGTWELIN